jgi:SAM-dependent methyltransferase
MTIVNGENAGRNSSLDTPADFLRSNRATYDSLAPAYHRRVETDVINDLPIVFRFWSRITERFKSPISLIDLGCGHGVNLAMFQRLGATTTGVDFAPKMLAVAKGTSPTSAFVLGEFLSSKLPKSAYQAVFAKAFVHLFPESECSTLFDKIRDLLVPGGLLYIATTVSTESFEGYLPKNDYPDAPLRFRRVWSEPDLLQVVLARNFRLIDRWTNEEPGRHKHWLNVVLEATDGT